jgi:hypothetical protein
VPITSGKFSRGKVRLTFAHRHYGTNHSSETSDLNTPHDSHLSLLDLLVRLTRRWFYQLTSRQPNNSPLLDLLVRLTRRWFYQLTSRQLSNSPSLRYASGQIDPRLLANTSTLPLPDLLVRLTRRWFYQLTFRQPNNSPAPCPF